MVKKLELTRNYLRLKVEFLGIVKQHVKNRWSNNGELFYLESEYLVLEDDNSKLKMVSSDR